MSTCSRAQWLRSQFVDVDELGCAACARAKDRALAYGSKEEVAKAISTLNGWGPPALGEEDQDSADFVEERD